MLPVFTLSSVFYVLFNNHLRFPYNGLLNVLYLCLPAEQGCALLQDQS